MKLWLLEILACPIDKAFPLKMTILNWQNEANDIDIIKDLIERYQNGEVLEKNMQTPLKIDSTDEKNLLINDLLILKPTEFSQYLSELLEKIKELDFVQDKSKYAGTKALELISNQVRQKLGSVLDTLTSEETKIEEQQILLKEITLELEFLNIFIYKLEIEDAVIECPQCQRWYPVFETIPQMLPDNVRDIEKDQNFINDWKDKYNFPKRKEE